jgi:tripartite-type tricarboxylate transporter receptor subunit TctC
VKNLKAHGLQVISSMACGLALLASHGLSAAQGSVQNYPDKPIKIIVPYTPGGGTDTVTRRLVERISADNPKWQFVVDNKAGGGGNIGLDLVAKAKPDGYTLGMGQAANLAINSALQSKMPYDASKDFTPVALVAEQPMVIVVRTDSTWKSVADLVAAGKAKPNSLRQALAGTGTVGHLAGELLAKRAGFKALNVPYKGAAPALTDLMGGQTDYMFATPQAVLGMLQATPSQPARLKALAVTSSKRLSVLSNIPTIAESGYKDFEAVDWKAVVAPAGLPPAIAKSLHAAIERALTNPAFIARLADDGSAPMVATQERAAKYIAAEQTDWGALIRDAGIKNE